MTSRSDEAYSSFMNAYKEHRELQKLIDMHIRSDSSSNIEVEREDEQVFDELNGDEEGLQATVDVFFAPFAVPLDRVLTGSRELRQSSTVSSKKYPVEEDDVDMEALPSPAPSSGFSEADDNDRTRWPRLNSSMPGNRYDENSRLPYRPDQLQRDLKLAPTSPENSRT
jgi:hypothetical protein